MLPLRLRFASLVLLAGLIPLPAAAITFNLVYVDPATDSESIPPKHDAGGAKLTAMVEQAAAEWAGIVEDDHDMTIRYYYADISSQTANALPTAVSPDFRKTTEGLLRVYPDRDWFFDPTPHSDSEFQMRATVLDDLSTQDQAAGFRTGSGGLPQLEVGYRGDSSDPDAANSVDLLSSIRHEIGHLMGVTGNFTAATNETSSDLDYDFPTALIGGRSGAVRVFGSDLSPPQNLNSHLQPALPLMSGQNNDLGERRGITETDVLVAATVSGWSEIDLPRKTYYGPSSNFGDPDNWSGARVPKAQDTVSIRHGGTVALDANRVVGVLTLLEDSTLTTGARNLTVQGTATVGPSPGGGEAHLIVGPGGITGARNFVITDGKLTLAGGIASAAQGGFENRGLVEGRGTIRYDVAFNNEATLRADGGTLILDEAIPGSGARVSLGGFRSPGTVLALDGDLDIRVNLTGGTSTMAASFYGGMAVGAGHWLQVVGPLQITTGRLTLDGSGSQSAEFRGTRLEIADELLVDRLGSIDAAVEVLAGSEVTVPQANDTLTVRRGLEQSGGTILGDGTVVIEGDYEATAGQLIVGEITFGGGSEWTDASVVAGVIDASAGGSTQRGGLLSFGKYTGKLIHEAGLLQAEDSLLFGTYEQAEPAVFGVEINSETDYGSLIVSETAQLAGSVSVLLGKDYEPAGGELYAILNAGDLEVDDLELIGPDADRFDWLVDGDTLFLEARTVLAGDYNADGLVDAADYTLWRDGDPSADANGDGQVNAADYTVWANNYGASASATSNAVPEPTTLVLAVLGLLACRRTR